MTMKRVTFRNTVLEVDDPSPLTAAQVATVVERTAAGEDATAIAKTLGCRTMDVKNARFAAATAMPARTLTAEDVEHMRGLCAERVPAAAQAIILGTGLHVVNNARRRLGISLRAAYRPSTWTEEQDAYLRSHFLEMGRRQLAEALGQSENNVRTRLKALGLSGTRAHPVRRNGWHEPGTYEDHVRRRGWTDEQIAYVRAHAASEPLEAVAKAVSAMGGRRSTTSVYRMAVHYGLRGGGGGRGRSFTDAERALMTNHRRTLTVHELAALMPDTTAAGVRLFIEQNKLTNRRRDQSLAERVLWGILRAHGVPFEHNHRLIVNLPAGPCTRELDVVIDATTFPDVVTPKGVIIEVQGDFWHGNPALFPAPTEKQATQRRVDAEKAAALQAQGWCTLALWEDDLFNRPEDCEVAVLNTCAEVGVPVEGGAGLYLSAAAERARAVVGPELLAALAEQSGVKEEAATEPQVRVQADGTVELVANPTEAERLHAAAMDAYAANGEWPAHLVNRCRAARAERAKAAVLLHELRLTYGQLLSLARAAGCAPQEHRRGDGFWADDGAHTDALLRGYAEGLTNRAVAARLGLTEAQVKDRALVVGVRRTRPWTAEQQAFLERSARTLPSREIADALGVNIQVVLSRLARMGLPQKVRMQLTDIPGEERLRRPWMQSRHWTEEKLRYVRDHCRTVPINRLAREVGVPEPAVHDVVHRMNWLPGGRRRYRRFTPADLLSMRTWFAAGLSVEAVAERLRPSSTAAVVRDRLRADGWLTTPFHAAVRLTVRMLTAHGAADVRTGVPVPTEGGAVAPTVHVPGVAAVFVQGDLGDDGDPWPTERRWLVRAVDTLTDAGLAVCTVTVGEVLHRPLAVETRLTEALRRRGVCTDWRPTVCGQLGLVDEHPVETMERLRTWLATLSADTLAPPRSASLPERVVIAMLLTHGVALEYSASVEAEGTRAVDVLVPGARTVVEVDGTFWHGGGAGRPRLQPGQDAAKDAALRRVGFTVHRVPEAELFAHPAAVERALVALLAPGAGTVPVDAYCAAVGLSDDRPAAANKARAAAAHGTPGRGRWRR